MSDIIQLLPDSVANQIAAGEVIQRPASVIKELVENSVDAGAKNIHVLVTDAGRTSIQVVDDGKGMSETDARLSFERHATSKIRRADDLFSLHTMGFRGEALPSIAAVAQIELRTRQATEDIGTCLMLSNSRIVSQEPCACPVGCNFKVNNIFYNVPARRKFLKSNATELNNIITAFERIVLVYPGISFTLHSNGGEVFNLKAGSLRQRILDVFGKKLDADLLPVDADVSFCKIKGFVGKPESSKKKCQLQYLFVNGRFMKHPYFAKAVQHPFERLVPNGEQVPYFLYFDVEPADIDVNIHPTKTEIKFENEQQIWTIISSAVREAIGVFNDVPTIDFDTVGKPSIPMFTGDEAHSLPTMKVDPAYNPFATKPQQATHSVKGWDNLFPQQKISSYEQPTEDIFSILDGDNAEEVSPIADKSSSHYQHKGKYIMTSVNSGLLIVDQHRAHVRVLYEEYRKRMDDRKPISQRMVFPEAVQFDACDAALLDMVIEEMESMGFELTPLGACNYAINSVPAGLEGLNASTLVKDLVDDVVGAETSVKEEIIHELAQGLARKAAIPHGQVLSNEEMDDLINRLFVCENSNYTPDGRVIFSLFKQSELDKMFG